MPKLVLLGQLTTEHRVLSGGIVGATIAAVIMVPIRIVYLLWKKFESRDYSSYSYMHNFWDDFWQGSFIDGVVSAAMALVGIIVATVVASMARSEPLNLIGISGVVLIGGFIFLSIGFPVLYVIGLVTQLVARTIVLLFSNMLLLFTAGLGVSVGMGFIIGFHNTFMLLALAATGLPLFTMLFFTMLLYPLFKHRRLIAKYRKSEQHLIQP